jgi:hypothetical protein
MPWARRLRAVLYFKPCKSFVFILVTFGSRASTAVERSERTQNAPNSQTNRRHYRRFFFCHVFTN